MSWFAILLMATAAAFVTANGGRAQLQIAQLAQELGQSRDLLVSALIASSVMMALAAWLGLLARELLGEGVAGLLAALALLGAAVELFWPIRIRKAKEPTRSLGAISLVLAARQMADAPRLVILAAALQLANGGLPGLGGALGAGLALAMGWRFGELVDRQIPANVMRWMMGLILLILALLLGVQTIR